MKKKAYVRALSDTYYYVRSNKELYVLDISTKKKILLPDEALFIDDHDKNLLLVGNINQSYHIRLDTGVVFKK